MTKIGRKVSVYMITFLVVVISISVTFNQTFIWLCVLLFPFIWSLGRNDDYRSAKKEHLKKQGYGSLIHSFSGSIFVWDLTNEELYFSKGMEQLFGYPEKQLKKSKNLWKEIVHQEDWDALIKDKKRLLEGDSTKIEFRIQHPKDGEKWIMKIATPIVGEDGKVLLINGQMIDITERKQVELKLKQMAYFDDLTDLPNRKLLDRHIKKALARSKRHQDPLSVMFIDLDDFKLVNDTFGHEVGDSLLKEVVKRMKSCIREEDLIARVGGDEFVVVFEQTSKQEVEHIAKRIVENVGRPYFICDHETSISLSIGISMYPNDGMDKETLINRADQAMYLAKFSGKNTYEIFSS